MPNVHA